MANTDLTRPHVFEKGTSSRTILALHGTGADEHDLLGLARALDPDASILSPRGMYLENGMNRFFERYPDGTFNEESIDTAVDELSEFLAAAVAEYGLDDSNIVGTGFSNGANTISALLVRRPTMFIAAVLFGSTVPYAYIEPADLTGMRIWFANGDYDSYAPADVSERWVEQLRDFGADATWLRHPGGHQISGEHVRLIAEALRS